MNSQTGSNRFYSSFSWFITAPVEKKLEWTLRIASAMCFIGHGAFGIITKQDWVPFFNIVGIGEKTAFQLMPWVGIMDIGMGILILIRPFRIILGWMVVWAVWTALLRPLDGRGVWEFLERAGNYGVPFALLFMMGFPSKLKKWFFDFQFRPLRPERKKILGWTLRITTALLLIGHGGFGAVMHKSMLIGHFNAVGLPLSGWNPETFITVIGIFEILLGILILIKPLGWILILALVWKVFTELLYPLSGDWIFEFIERFGSYGAPLALYFLIKSDKKS